MQNLLSAESLRAAAELVIVLDHYRFGASAFLALFAVTIVGLAVQRRAR